MTGDLEELVAATVAGQSLTQISAAAGMSVSTVQRRLKDPEVVALVNEARAEHRQETLGRLYGLRARAVERLKDLLEDDDPTIVLRTATLVLGTTTKFELIADLDQRVNDLETHARMLENTHDDPGSPDDAFS